MRGLNTLKLLAATVYNSLLFLYTAILVGVCATVPAVSNKCGWEGPFRTGLTVNLSNSNQSFPPAIHKEPHLSALFFHPLPVCWKQ